jgi:hypothetical protein
MPTRRFTSFFAAVSIWIMMIYYWALDNSPFAIPSIELSYLVLVDAFFRIDPTLDLYQQCKGKEIITFLLLWIRCSGIYRGLSAHGMLSATSLPLSGA